MNWFLLFGIWFAVVVVILMFMRGATYLGNISEDPDYYKKD